MIYIDNYDKEILGAIRKSPGISPFDLRETVGRPTPFRKRMRRLLELGLIKQKTTPYKKIMRTVLTQKVQKLYLNDKLFKETICVKNEKEN